MGNSVYQDDIAKYGWEKKAIDILNEARWFYKRLDIKIGKDNPKEAKLRQYMDALREDRKKKMVTGEELYPAAVPFYHVKEWIKERGDTLWRIFRKMPKGGLLHVHSAAALSTDAYLELLKEWSVKALHEPDKFPPIVVVTRCEERETKYLEGMLLFVYQLRGAENIEVVSLAHIMNNEMEMEKLKKKLSICSDESEKTIDIWREFNHIFARIDNLFTNEDFYREYHIAFFKECAEDNIGYVEMRSGFQEFCSVEAENEIWSYAGRHQEYHVDRHLYFKELTAQTDPQNPDGRFLILLEEARLEALRRGLIPETFSFRIILNARRDLDPAKEAELAKLSMKVDAAITLKEKPEYAKRIIGFDFVSEEDRGQPTSAYVETVIYQPFGAGYGYESPDKSERIKRINFFLHDGESCWKADDNVTDAAIVSKHRIGHGFNMNLFRATADEITAYHEGEEREKLIEPVLEICPISNQLLHYYHDIRNHSAYELMKNGICCVIANDDPLLLGNGGLSYDYWEAYVGMELPMEAIKASVYIAFLYRQFSYGAKSVFPYDDAMEELNGEWNRFVDEMCAELRIE
ncbi:MAG: hypothetical protein NC231_06915 [Bacillus sp. (in: Bacteria)]|nr:hypothetical protein [Bacillus sp. (in: firmicutes)]MCM1426663.1 hypothetical protein [Eubacterium sp.]